MRLKSLLLQKYGNYDAERIIFDPTPGSVNILLAPNSAGKSVLRNAFTDLLFGIHNQTPMGFRFGYTGMQVAADMVRSDGSTFSFHRRKARGNNISDATGQTLDIALLHGILGGRDRTLLERLFVLDTESLRDGGKALLESGGDVASALLSAAGGIRQARALKQRLEKQRDELAPLRKVASRPFYVALDRFLQARRAHGSATLRPDEWQRQGQELAALQAQQRDSNATAEAASAEIARLERIRRVRPALARQAEAAMWLAATPDAPALPPGLGEYLSAAQIGVVTKQDAADRTGIALSEAERDAAEIVVNSELLARAEEIERLTGEAGAARKARDDLPGIEAQCASALTRISSLARQLGLSLPAERSIEALPDTASLTRTRNLIDSYGQITGAILNSDTQMEALQRDLVGIERQISELPPSSDIRPLESLLDNIRADGDPTARLSDAEKALAECQAALHAACARIPGWSGEITALTALAPLTTDMYSRHEKELAIAHRATETARQRHEDESERLAQASSALEAIANDSAIPDEATLNAARTQRDRLWRVIYRDKFGLETTDDEPAETGGMPLPLAFERSIGTADAVADRRYAGSELLARAATARQAVADAKQRADASAERLRLTHEKLSQARRVWAQICAPLPLGEEPALGDIQTFLEARERVIEVLRRRDIALGGLETLRRRHRDWAGMLADRLDHRSSNIAELLGIAERTLARQRELREQRARLEAGRGQLTDQLRAAEAARSSQQAKLATWHGQWRAAMVELGRPEAEEPAVTVKLLDLFREIAAEHREAASLAERVSGMKAVIDRFTRSVADLRHLASACQALDDPFEIARELGRALNQERAKEQRRRIAGEALARARAAAGAAGQALLDARSRMRGTLDLIGADTIEAAQGRLALSAERARQEALIQAATAELHAFGDGLSVDTLNEEAKQVGVDELPARMEAAATVRKDAGAAAQKMAEEASALRHRMEQEAADTNVNAAAADQQAAIASLSRTLDEALVYHTASLLLGRALEVIEKSGDSKLLQRLGATFQTMTNNAYTRVVTELDDGGAARLGLIQRDFPEERQSIDQLSEGTRDQLFLALRVVAIEDHLTSAEPLPFIGDDILQTFDDDRALAALRVLADLSQHTQVIVLTHHRHIPELATRLPEGRVFACRRESAAVTT